MPEITALAWLPRKQIPCIPKVIYAFVGQSNKRGTLKFSYTILISLLLAGCMPPPQQPTPTSIGTTPTLIATFPSTAQPTPTDTPQPAEDPIVVGAGDIADCSVDGD